MADRDLFRISVRVLENGYVVEVPDMEEIKKKEADAKKNYKGPGQPYCYTGDCTKSFAAKSPAQVVKYVKQALEQLPDAEYDSAFAEAAAASPKSSG
jgi:hypothetical protein